MSVAHAYICFAKESYFDNVCKLKTDPCQNPTMKNSDHLLELFLPNQKKQNFQGFNTLSNSNHKMKQICQIQITKWNRLQHIPSHTQHSLLAHYQLIFVEI